MRLPERVWLAASKVIR